MVLRGGFASSHRFETIHQEITMNAIINTPILSAMHAPATQAAFASERALSHDMFQQAKACWKAASARKELTSDSLAAWAVIRGADPKKGFCAITNPVKLANGAQPWAAYEQSMRSCSRLTRSALAPWESMLSEHGGVLRGYQWTGAHPLLAALSACKPA